MIHFFFLLKIIRLTFCNRNLSGPDKTAATVLLRLFKLVFSAIPLFPENESVLQPHLATIITSAMKYHSNFFFFKYIFVSFHLVSNISFMFSKHASEVKESLNYFALLRSLFRSIGGGKFDLFMKEFLPLLPGMLICLSRFDKY